MADEAIATDAQGWSADLIERACEVMHVNYEAAAVFHGWQSQSPVAWPDVPEANKATMREAVAALLRWLYRVDTAPVAEPVGVAAPPADNPLRALVATEDAERQAYADAARTPETAARVRTVLAEIDRAAPPETPPMSAAELLREVKARDPEAHNRALGRAYGVGPRDFYPDGQR